MRIFGRGLLLRSLPRPPPDNTVAPVASGAPSVGSVLSVTTGTWTYTGSIAYSYQWQRDDSGGGVYSNIAAATTNSYSLVEADGDCNVRCVVTATDDVGASAANSNALGTVTELPVNVVAPSLPSMVRVAQLVEVDLGTWLGHPAALGYTYQWQTSATGTGGWSNIAGATAAAYTPVLADEWLYLRCAVTAINSAGSTTATTSALLIYVAFPNGVPLVKGMVEVGWEGPTGGSDGLTATVGAAIVGTSTVGLTAWDQSFSGTYDDITDDVDLIHVARGKPDPISALAAGTCTISGRDPIGKYNPKNDSSVLAGDLVPLRMVRVTLEYLDDEYRRFVGFIRSIEWRPSGRGGEFTIEAVDLFVWLNRSYPVIPSTGATTTGAAIGRILDEAGWIDPTQRDLDTGDTLADFSADGTHTALELIEDLLAAERGFFFIASDGTATYRDRHAHARTTTPAGTIEDIMQEVVPGTALDSVKNTASVTATGGAEQTAADPDSVFFYGTQSYNPIESAYLADDEAALQLADWLVGIGKDPRAPLWNLTVGNRDEPTYSLMLNVDLGTLLTVTEPKGGTDFGFFVEGYEETIDTNTNHHEWALSLTERPTAQDFIIGYSEVGADVLGF